MSPELTSLHELAYYVREQVGVKECDPRTYVSTESMVPNKGGITVPDSIPTSGKVSKYHSGDVLLSNIRPYYRKIWKADCDGCCSTDVLVIRAKDSRLSDYLFAVLSDERFFDYVMQGSKGTKMPRGDKNQILNYQIIKTDTTSMNNIGFLDSLILNNIRTIEAINDNLIKQMISYYESLDKSKWNVVSADTIFDVGIGKTPPRKESEWFSIPEDEQSIRWISISDMGKTGMYIAETAESLTQDAVNTFNVRLVPDNTVILSFKLTVGRVAITDGQMCTNEAIAHFKTDDSRYTELLYSQLSTYNYEDLGNTSSIATAVNSKTIRSMELHIPPEDSLADIHSILAPIAHKVKINQQEIRKLVELRDYLLPKLLSGKIDVTSFELPTKYSFTRELPCIHDSERGPEKQSDRQNR